MASRVEAEGEREGRYTPVSNRARASETAYVRNRGHRGDERCACHSGAAPKGGPRRARGIAEAPPWRRRGAASVEAARGVPRRRFQVTKAANLWAARPLRKGR